MNIPTPKFAMGQTVWKALTHMRTKIDQCPDCLNTFRAKLTLGTGEEISIACPTCEGRGIRSGEYIADARPLTIGSVRLDTNEKTCPVSYMCEETGIGTGTVHYECDLFLTRPAALVRATMLALEAMKGLEERQRWDREQAAQKRKATLLGYLRRKIIDLKKEIESVERHITSITEGSKPA